jgi:cholesterol transport system auxiliary component
MSRTASATRRLRVAAVGCLALAAAGCSNALLGPEGEAPVRYRLDAPAAGADVQAPVRVPLALAVARPRAAVSLDGERIAVVQPGSRFDHYAGVRWSEPAPEMLQSLLVRTLQATGRFETVVAAPSRVPADLLLVAELRRFEARYATAGAAPVVEVEMQFTLVDIRGGRRIPGPLATAQAQAAEGRRAEVAAAFQRATGEVLARASSWLAGAELPAAAGK